MRLIDADKLLEKLDTPSVLVNRLRPEDKETVRNIVKSQPTVYDIDKVVNRLEEMKTIDGSMKTKMCIKFDEMTVNRAIEIVKQGVR